MKKTDYFGLLSAIFLVGTHVDHSIGMEILFWLAVVSSIICGYVEYREEKSEELGE